ncbi:MAG: hypothetical protein ABL921_35200 [Pirellula sp.]
MLNQQAPVVTKRLSWPKAFIKSLSAVLLCSIAMGFLFAPKELTRRRAKTHNQVLSCVPAPDGKSVFTLLSSLDTEHTRSARVLRVLHHDLSENPAPPPQVICSSFRMACLALDPIGSRLLVADQDGTLYSIGLLMAGKKKLGLLAKGCPMSIQISRDGKLMILHDVFGVHAWNIDLSVEESSPLWFRADRSLSCFVIDPDSQTVVCGRTFETQSELVEFNIQTGEIKSLLQQMPGSLKRLAISSDGRFLAAVNETGEIALFQRALTQEPWQSCSLLGLCSGSLAIACFSPDGELLITSDRDNRRLCAWDLQRKEMRYEFDSHTGFVRGCEFIVDDQILSWSSDNTLRVWNLQSSSPVREIKL